LLYRFFTAIELSPTRGWNDKEHNEHMEHIDRKALASKKAIGLAGGGLYHDFTVSLPILYRF
jgi:hypothetical protein